MEQPNEPEKITIRVNTDAVLKVAKVLAALALVALAYKGVTAMRLSRVSSQAAELLDGGYPRMAFEVIEPYRESFVSDADSCALLLDTDLAVGRYDRVEWGYEACKRNKVGSFAVFYAHTRLEEHWGNYQQAIRELYDLRDFHRAKVYENLVDILASHNYREEALRAAEDGIRKFPEVEALRVRAIKLDMLAKKPAEAARHAAFFKPAAIAGRLGGDTLAIVLSVFAAAGDSETVNQIKAAESRRAQAMHRQSPEGRSAVPPAPAPAQ